MAERMAERYVQVSPYQTNLFPHSIQTLEDLKNEGYQLHIITNGFKEVQHIKLEKSKLIQYFDVILCFWAGHAPATPVAFLISRLFKASGGVSYAYYKSFLEYLANIPITHNLLH